DSAGEGFAGAVSCVLAKSSLVTGLALRTSGAFGITPAAATGFGEIVGAAGAAGATDAPLATPLGDVPAGAGVAALAASAGDTLGIFERIEVRRDIDIQEFAVDKEEAFCIGQARKLRKIVRLNFREPGRADLCHTRRFIERKISGAPRLLKFFTESFYRHWRENTG